LGVTLDSIRRCLEGVIPSTVGTVAPDGTPNVTNLSIVQYVDSNHVALSFQFFNKTRANLLLNPRAQVMVVDPVTVRHYRLDLAFERTERSGPLFETMNARLSAIASMSGMTRVFRLQGSDVYRVLACEEVPPGPGVQPEKQSSATAPGLDGLSRLTDALSACWDLEDLVSKAIRGLRELMGYEHAVLLLADETGERLLAVDSQGAVGSGAGAEVRVGEGIWGTAAAQQCAIRIGRLRQDLRYSTAVRRRLESAGEGAALEREIPWPGLERPESLLAVPLVRRGELIGLLGLESAQPLRFGPDDEAAVGVVARQLALLVADLGATAEQEAPAPGTGQAPAPGRLARVRYYAEDDSVFIDERYVIKGLSGRILYRLLRIFASDGRTDFSNKELRADPQLQLSALRDNLETRLLLLRRRLDDRAAPIRLVRTGRGQLRLQVEGRVEISVGADAIG
jgi:predicted pyridoxine 5'-phosphate oxidase superfamily flavin-nucleotide-binding protein